MTAARKPTDPRRQRLLAKIHVAKKELAIPEDAYRAMIARHGKGKDSAGGMTVGQLIAVVEELKAKGWKDARRPPKRAAAARKLADGEQAAKLRALWIACWNLGAVKDPSEAALGAYVKRMCKVDAMQWAEAAALRRAIEGAKAIAARAGVDWTDHADPRRCVIRAQARRLGLPPREVGLIGWRLGLPAFDSFYQPEHWDRLANILGERIREAAGG